jgi:hypothetical protein
VTILLLILAVATVKSRKIAVGKESVKALKSGGEIGPPSPLRPWPKQQLGSERNGKRGGRRRARVGKKAPSLAGSFLISWP